MVITMKRLRDLREDNDLSQADIAKILNCSQATYSRYETGELSIAIDALIKLAKFYDTSIDYIVQLTDVKKAYVRKKN